MTRTKKSAIKRRQEQPELGKEECDSRLSSYFPFLFDGRTGQCAWIPVDFEAEKGVHHEVVVISKPVVRYFCKNEFGITTTTAATAYFDNFCEKLLPDYSVDFTDDEFRMMSLKTPFKAFYAKEGCSPVCLRPFFKVVCARAFKDLMAEWRVLYPIQRRRDFFLNKKTAASLGQKYAFRGGLKSTGKIAELSNYEISFEDKKYVPALGVPYWTELYTPMFVRFFDMPTGVNRHVVRGEVGGVGSKVVPGFNPSRTPNMSNPEKIAAKKKRKSEKNAAKKKRKREQAERLTMERIRDDLER